MAACLKFFHGLEVLRANYMAKTYCEVWFGAASSDIEPGES